MASYWRKTASAPSLEDLSHHTVFSALGKLAGSVKCNFCCGGALSQLSSVVLEYKKPSGEWSSEPVQLPLGLANEESMKTFLASCSTASFGIGSEMVVDKSYRNALLSFYCQHKYVNISTNIDKFSPHLKGEDAVVYEVIKSLGLLIALRPILSNETCKGPPVSFDGEPEFSKAGNFALPDFKPYNQDCNLYYGKNESEYDFVTQT